MGDQMVESGKANNAIIAHLVLGDNGQLRQHLLMDHLKSTANKASEFAAFFGGAEWAALAGFWHDLGKYLPAWQRYIMSVHGCDGDAHVETQKGRPNHSTAGAVCAFIRFAEFIKDKTAARSVARILAYCVSGHHAGLPDWSPDEAGGDLSSRIFKGDQIDTEQLAAIQAIEESHQFIRADLPRTPPVGMEKGRERNEAFHLWIRMLFSCLVDGDYLDTEKFMKPEQAVLRGRYPSLDELKLKYDSFMNRKIQGVQNSPLNIERKRVLDLCRKKASLPPGFFSLNVPTGGGKTLSSMAFALEHALKYGKRRIIVAIPYTSIIEQTVSVYRYGTDDVEKIKSMSVDEELFGEMAVLAHHSAIDPDKETAESLLAAENWDAPIIVTTNVQLFESLFASRSSRCRRLHNIAQSVIILDEAQMLPPEFLQPVISVLKTLVDHFGVTVVFCTATQPAFQGSIGSVAASFEGVDHVLPIIDDADDLARSFSRVSISVPLDYDIRSSWEDVSKELLQYPQVLCIVNSRADCRALHSMMPPETVHLSALMCPEERGEMIDRIKSTLLRGENVRVVSTQLVEAGVDIDFPVVYRAMAGLDSIAQAAGRCNREMKLNRDGKLGKVVVFNPPNPSPRGLLRKGEDAAKSVLRLHKELELTPAVFTDYFERFYSMVGDFDKPKFYERLVEGSGEFKFQFRSFSSRFHLIDDFEQRGVVIWYQGMSADSRELIEKLKKEGPKVDILRRLQRFTVTVPVYYLNMLVEKGFIGEDETHGYAVQIRPELYRAGLGLLYNAEWDSSTLVF